ncbi:hypothetical protein HMPREF0496_1090 [Lentilactobacillus hilgardii ATCC 27305]|nr:hypothetical protein HMPREF0496_1090 [Lentilactobacillus hilgardii ATCC 27305]
MRRRVTEKINQRESKLMGMDINLKVKMNFKEELSGMLAR